MEITRDNYEEFFIDYLEGNIDDKMVDQFIEFLQKNPDLKDELKAFKSFSTVGEDVFFPGKGKLYKEKYDSQKEFDLSSVAIIENDLSPEETCNFQAYLEKHPEKIKEFELFKKTRLMPDESEVFKNKKRLYRTTKTKQILYFGIRIAAILALIFSFTILLKKNNEIKVPPVQIVKLSEDVKYKLENKVPPKALIKDTKKTQLKPTVKDSVKTEPAKSIREKTRGRIEDGEMAVIVRETQTFSTLAALDATLYMPEFEIILVGMDRKIQPDFQVIDDSDEKPLLAEVVKEKTGLNRFRFNKITKAGLNFIAGISGKKFSYDTDKKGDITEINLDTRLLAFSIPTGKEGGKQ
jgi:hypothetical protein